MDADTGIAGHYQKGKTASSKQARSEGCYVHCNKCSYCWVSKNGFVAFPSFLDPNIYSLVSSQYYFFQITARQQQVPLLTAWYPRTETMSLLPKSSLLFLFLSLLVPSAFVRGDNDDEDSTSRARRRLAQNQECVLAKMEQQLENGGRSVKWRCELQGSDYINAGGMRFIDLEGFEEEDFEFVLSGTTTLLPGEGTIIEDGRLKLLKGTKKEFGKIEKRGPAAKRGSKNKSKGDDAISVRRRLAVVDERKVLAVRVKASDASTTSTLDTIGDKIFGTAGDVVNLRERFRTCSYGEVLMEPFQGTTKTGKQIANGVYEVTITSNAGGRANGNVADDVVSALEKSLGTLATQFDHVMLCLPPGTTGNWIAWGKFTCFWRSLLDGYRIPMLLTLWSHFLRSLRTCSIYGWLFVGLQQSMV